MSWVVGGIGYPAICYAEPKLMEIAMPFYLFVGSVVGCYIGFSTADDKWQGR